MAAERARLLLSESEIQGLRNASATSSVGRLRQRVLEVAEKRLEWEIPREPPLVPPVRNSWQHHGGGFQGIDEEHGRIYQEQYRTAMLIRNLTELFAFCHLLTDDPRFLARARDWLLFPCNWANWGAYAPSRDPLGAYSPADLETLARSGGEVVDVAWDEDEGQYYPIFEDTGIFTTFKLRGLAIAYSWLRDRLDTPDRSTVRDVLVREGGRLHRAAASGKGLLLHRMLNHTWFDVAGFGLTGLALADEHPEAGDWVRLARNKFANTLLPEALGRDGDFPEPPACVWEYALMNGVLFLEALRKATGEDLLAHPHMREVPRFLLKAMNPQRGFTFDEEMTFDDAEGNIYGLRPVILRLAAHHRDGAAQWLALQEELEAPGADCGKYYPGGPWFPRTREYNGHWELAWFDPELQATPPAADERCAHLRDVGWVMMGSGWNASDSFVAFKSGPYLGPHDKLDQNKFVLAAHGEQLVEKFRLDCYRHADFFRRTIGNSTVLVDGCGQDASRDGLTSHARVAIEYKREVRSGRIVRFEHAEDHAWTLGDASAAYAELDQFHRYLLFLRPEIFVILDVIRGKGPAPRTYEWLLHSKGDIAIHGNGLSVSKGAVNLHATFLLPEDPEFDLRESPPDFDGRSWNYVAAKPTQAAAATHFLTVLHPVQEGPPAEARLISGPPQVALAVRWQAANWNATFDLDRQQLQVQRSGDHATN